MYESQMSMPLEKYLHLLKVEKKSQFENDAYIQIRV